MTAVSPNASIVFCGIGLVVASVFLGSVQPESVSPLYAVAAYGLVAVAGLTGAALLWRRRDRGALVFIIGIALVARVSLLPSIPLTSLDVYRYLWDGNLIIHGLDPYLVAPADPTLAGLQQSWMYPHIYWRDIASLYPPLAQAIFAAAALVDARNLLGIKSLLMLGDVATIALLIFALRSRSLPAGRVAVYAWSPLVLLEFGQSGHIEAWSIAALVAAIVLAGRRTDAAAVALAGAILLKLYPIIFAPALFARRGLRPFAILLGIVALGYAPFVLWDRQVFGSLLAFAYEQNFNETLHLVLHTAGSVLVLVVAIAVAALLTRRGGNRVQIVFGLLLVYLAVLPSVLPWYAIAIVALIPLLPSSPEWRVLEGGALLFAVLTPLAYNAPFVFEEGSPLNVALRVLEYAPLVAGLGYFCFARRATLVPWKSRPLRVAS